MHSLAVALCHACASCCCQCIFFLFHCILHMLLSYVSRSLPCCSPCSRRSPVATPVSRSTCTPSPCSLALTVCCAFATADGSTQEWGPQQDSHHCGCCNRHSAAAGCCDVVHRPGVKVSSGGSQYNISQKELKVLDCSHCCWTVQLAGLLITVAELLITVVGLFELLLEC